MTKLIEHLQKQELLQCPQCGGTNARTILAERVHGKKEVRTRKCDRCGSRWKICGGAIYMPGQELPLKHRHRNSSSKRSAML